MQLHIPTIFVLLIVTSVILALSIGVITRRDDQDGLLPFIAALGLVALAFILFPLRGHIPDVLSLWIGNVAVSGAYALILVAFAQFQQRRLSVWMVAGPTLLIAVSVGLAITWLPISLFGRIFITNSIFVFQGLLLLNILIPGIRKTAGRGQYLIIAGVVLHMGSFAARGIILYSSEMESVTHIADAGVSQSVIFLASFVFLILCTLGFVLMVKERADDNNRLMATTDPLTGCWNRLRILECAQLEMLRRQRYDLPVSMLMIDIDFFKAVNDHYGHGVGDQLLKEFSVMVRGCLREADQFGRWGGEEFIVLLPSSDAAAAAAIGERIRRLIEITAFANGLRITISLGFAEYQPAETFEDWMGRADTAVYQAKHAGRNRVEPHLESSAQVDEPTSLGMVRLIWKPEYETGHTLIDEQHKEFFRQGNGLLDAILRHDSPQNLKRRIEAFLAFVDVHFETEEKWLDAQNWPDSAAHAHHHQNFAARAAELLTKHNQDQLDATDFLHFFIDELILQHLLIDDRKFASDLRMRSARINGGD